ncbi:UbiA-like protein EboC [Arenibacter sp. BSSL-BM3]|uniref:UbiA-like protein EboC n=1 Tax=Arenibacter arenosicollis TaxID=2762274 RepID=A0ABR7QNH3_9FLAO|nr:UbiA-like protein EboC [Arenibacter arenosicollis]MBC8768718.1 UbiA-like protein EboC [Arenibacter arenosicollis]
MNPVFKGYLRLARPANLPTAAADIFAGVAISGLFMGTSLNVVWDTIRIVDLLLLIFSSVFLYAAGVVLNDVFDHKLDKIERPERPIPSGLISVKSAAIFGGVLMNLGVLSAFLVSSVCGIIAFALGLAILLYDALGKHHSFLGPLNMGVCRGLNLLLGISILGDISNWGYFVFPVVYIAAITLISRGEVHGNNKSHILFAGGLYTSVILGIIVLFSISNLNLLESIPFLLLFAFLVFRPLLKAYKENSPQNIKKAVMAGVISIIVLDATLAVGFSYWWVGLITLLLLPLSIFLSKLFAVT